MDTLLQHFPAPQNLPTWVGVWEPSLEDWNLALDKTPCHTGAGWCGWRQGELAALPTPYVLSLLQILRAIGQSGRWPRVLTTLRTVLIPKDEDLVNPQPSDLRPISVASLIVRIWFRALTWNMVWHLEKVIAGHPALIHLHGFRPSVAVEDSVVETYLTMIQHGTALQYLVLDLKKCFDTIS